MVTKQDPFHSHDRWIAVIMWIAVLVALVYTSGYATFLGFGGSITSFFQQLAMLGQARQSISNLPLLITTLLAMLLLVSQIILAWHRFAAFTNDLIVSYARTDRVGSINVPFFDLLIWDLPENEDAIDSEDQTGIEFDPEQADSTSVSDVLKVLGFAWVIILLTPPVLSIVATLSVQ
ncbi:MAG: hypothetical protein JXB07_00315 [Anaerolineae bacterium]|nr:hypothetical protein [Anaerolineae bacterium]